MANQKKLKANKGRKLTAKKLDTVKPLKDVASGLATGKRL